MKVVLAAVRVKLATFAVPTVEPEVDVPKATRPAPETDAETVVPL